MVMPGDQQRTKTTVQTFEYEKGRVFVSGLFWQPLPGVAAAARKLEIEKIANEQSFDLMVLRTSGILQVGFASSGGGARQGMMSAAAMISKTVQVEGRDRNLLCATEVVKGKWLYVAQREGVILHDGDLLASEDEVQARMLTDLSVSEWDTIFAPDHWGISGSVERAFKDFLPHSKKGDRVDYKKWWALKPVKKSFKAYLPLLGVIALSIAVAFGYKLWQKRQIDKELANIAAADAARESAAVQTKAKVEHPWKSMPRAMDLVRACDDAMVNRMKTLWPGNWSINELSCSGGVFKASWMRQDQGWIEHLLQMEPKAQISPDGKMATLVLPITPNSGSDEALVNGASRSTAMQSAAQRYGFKLSITEPQAPASLPGDKSPSQVMDKAWKELAWTASGSSLPAQDALSAMDGNGFRVQVIRRTYANGLLNWEMEGIQYAQP